MTPASRARLAAVHPDLQKVIELAYNAYAPRRFNVSEGLRTVERQRELVAGGASQTMNSRHITGHAVDLAVIIGNEARWELQLYTELALVVGCAAQTLDIPVIWGGCWVKINDAGTLDDELADYIKRCKSQGRKPFIDGPHFELDRSVYP
jgi:peptidoglycan L-alanyl-D-glutamate endopeptidase CwlK